MARQYRSGLVITGDATGAVNAARLTRGELSQLNRQIGQNSAGLRRMSADSQRMNVRSSNLNRTLATQAHKMVAWGAGIAGVSSVLASMNTQLDVIDNIHKMSLRIDASTEALSAYSYVAELSGTNIKQLSTAWQRQTRRIAEAAAGYGEARKALKELNLDAKALVKLRPEDQFEAIAKALEKVDSSADRLRLANKLFDTEGAAAALQIINQGTDAIEKLKAEAASIGIIITQETADSVAAFNDSLTKVGRSMTGVSIKSTTWLANTFTDDLNNVADIISGNASVMDEYGVAVTLVSGVLLSRMAPALAAKASGSLVAAAAVRAEAAATLSQIQSTNLATAAAVRSATAERARALHHYATSSALGVGRVATTRLDAAERSLTSAQVAQTATTSQLAAAQASYNRVATVGGRVTRGLKGAMGLLGGPLGVGILAATALLTMGESAETAAQKTKKLKKETNELIQSLENMSFAALQPAVDRMFEIRINKQKELATAQKELLDIQRNGRGGSATFARASAATKNIERLKAELKGIVIDAKRLDSAVEATFFRMTKGSESAANGMGDAADQSDKLSESQDKLLAKWAAQIPALEKLKKERANLLSIDVKDEKQQTKIAIAVKNLDRQIAKLGKSRASQIKQGKTLAQQLEEEYSLLKITNEKERRVEIQLRKLGANATAAQKNEIRGLITAIYEEEQAQKSAAEAIKATEKATKEAAKQADPYAKAWESATERIDESFANAWKGAFDSFEDFGDSLLDSFKNLLAEMAHQAITKKILVNVGLSGSGNAGTSSVLGGGSPLSGFSLKDGVDLFNPSSGGVVSSINNTAYKLGYGSNPALSNNVAAIKNGDFSSTLINPDGLAAQGLNAIGPGLSAYGFAQQYGFAGGVAGGVGSTALAGGVSGALAGTGALSGASSAVMGLHPLGWAAILGGALLGRKKPSDKTQSQAVDLDSFTSTYSGLSGKKFSQDNLDNSTGISSALSAFAQLLEQNTGTDFAGGLQVTTGGRDGQRFLYSPDGIDTVLSKDTNVTDNDTVITGGGAELLQNAVLFLAEIAGIDPSVYLALANENENLVSAYARLESQVDLVGGSLTDLDIPTASLAENALTAANEIIAANGGLEKYSRNQGFVNANFISAETRRLSLISDVQGQLNEWNDSLVEGGQAAVTSKDEFLTYIRAIDQTTEAGKALYATALELAPALVAIANESDLVRTQVTTLADKWATTEQKLAANTTQLALFNAGLGLVGDSTINSRSELLAYFETLDTGTISGRTLAQSALDVAPAIDALDNSIASLGTSAKDAYADALKRSIGTEQTGLDTLRGNLKAASVDYNSAISTEISKYNTQISRQNSAAANAQNLAKTWGSVALSIKDSRAQILNQLSSGSQLQDQQKQRFDALIKQAASGDVSAFQQLPGAAKSYQEQAASSALSSNELKIITAEIAGKLSRTQVGAESSLSLEQNRANNAARQTSYLSQSVIKLQLLKDGLEDGAEQALTIEEAAAAYRITERELANSHHETTIETLNAELGELETLNTNIVTLDEARRAYEQSQTNSDRIVTELERLNQKIQTLSETNDAQATQLAILSKNSRRQEERNESEELATA